MRQLLLLGSAALIFSACNPLSNLQSGASPSPAAQENANTNTDDAITDDNDTGGNANRTAEADTVTMPDGSVVVQLKEQNDSGQSGTATLKEVNGKVQLTMAMTGGNFSAPQPAHVHLGTCANIGAVKYPLENLTNGRSLTTISAKLTDLMTGTMSINVHQSATEIDVYTACGDIDKAVASASPTPGAGVSGRMDAGAEVDY